MPGPNLKYIRGAEYIVPDGHGFFGDEKRNFRLFWNAGVPTDGASGFAVGCDYTDTGTGIHYHNKGTTAAAVWKAVTTA